MNWPGGDSILSRVPLPLDPRAPDGPEVVDGAFGAASGASLEDGAELESVSD
ncbi:MAG: hypothetical protein R6U98_12425 [Pirellulaceae bacterium]